MAAVLTWDKNRTATRRLWLTGWTRLGPHEGARSHFGCLADARCGSCVWKLPRCVWANFAGLWRRAPRAKRGFGRMAWLTPAFKAVDREGWSSPPDLASRGLAASPA